MDTMNKESAIVRDDTLVVIDRTRRNRLVAAGAAAAAVLILLVAYLLMTGGRADTTAARPVAADAAGGQVPTVTVIVPGRSQVARVAVIAQMILDLLVLGLVVKVFVGAVETGRGLHRTRQDSESS